MELRFYESELPHQLEDEDKWFKVTKGQLFRIFVMAIISALIWKCLNSIGFGIVGIIIAAIIMIVTLILVLFKVPERLYLYGTGRPLYIPAMFMLFRHMRTKKIYAKVLNKDITDNDNKQKVTSNNG